MRIFHTNKATPGGVALVLSSSAASGYPATNAIHPFRSAQWKTGTASASESIEFQFPAAVSVKGVAILNHDLTVSDALTVQANSSSSWGSPPVSQALTIETEIKHVFGSAQSYRYWRLAMTKASAGLVRSIGVVLLASVYDTPTQPDYDGFKETLTDSSRVTKAIGGQIYSEILPKIYSHKLEFSHVDQTFKDNLDAIFQASGETGQIGFQVETSGVLTKLWYARLTNLSSFKVNAFDASLVYDASLEFEELL